MHKLSVALITKNEESTIERCLDSLKWADEIVILDGYSDDRTVEIVSKYTDKIYQKKFESFPIERDYILQKTTNDWVLSIDADMYFPPEFCQEIRDILSQDVVPCDGYYSRGLTIFHDHEVRHCTWFDWRYMRFFNKTKGGYDTDTYTVLDIFYVNGTTGRIQNYFLHYAKENFIVYYGKTKRTSYLSALEYKNKGVRINSLNAPFYLLVKPCCVFLYKYFVKLGFLDGVVGLIICMKSAICYFVAYGTLWDMQRREALGQKEYEY